MLDNDENEVDDGDESGTNTQKRRSKKEDSRSHTDNEHKFEADNDLSEDDNKADTLSDDEVEEKKPLKLSAANIANETFEWMTKSKKQILSSPPGPGKRNMFAIPSDAIKPEKFDLNATVEVRSR